MEDVACVSVTSACASNGNGNTLLFTSFQLHGGTANGKRQTATPNDNDHGIHAGDDKVTSIVHETAQVHETATVGHYCVIGAGVVLGPEVRVANYTIIDAGAQIGEGSAVWNWVHIREEVCIGPNCSIGDLVHIGPGCRLGHSVRVGNNTQIHHPAVIGDRAWIAPAVFLSNDARPNPGVPFSPQPVCVGDGAIIGAQCEVRGGVSIGAQAAIGMGSTVTRDVPPGALMYGVAATVKRAREQHYPGTAWAHYGPLGPEQHCPDCDRYMARQWKDREQE